MFNAIRLASRSSVRTFSSTPLRAADLSKLVLVGTLARDPESRLTRNDKEFISYTVATQNYPPPPPDVNGERRPATTTWHKILSFNDNSNKFLKTLRKGSKVYVEAGFELREPEAGADPSTPQGQRQLLLKHESIRVLNYPKATEEELDVQ